MVISISWFCLNFLHKGTANVGSYGRGCLSSTSFLPSPLNNTTFNAQFQAFQKKYFPESHIAICGHVTFNQWDENRWHLLGIFCRILCPFSFPCLPSPDCVCDGLSLGYCHGPWRQGRQPRESGGAGWKQIGPWGTCWSRTAILVIDRRTPSFEVRKQLLACSGQWSGYQYIASQL